MVLDLNGFQHFPTHIPVIFSGIFLKINCMEYKGPPDLHHRCIIADNGGSKTNLYFSPRAVQHHQYHVSRSSHSNDLFTSGRKGKGRNKGQKGKWEKGIVKMEITEEREPASICLKYLELLKIIPKPPLALCRALNDSWSVE